MKAFKKKPKISFEKVKAVFCKFFSTWFFMLGPPRHHSSKAMNGRIVLITSTYRTVPFWDPGYPFWAGSHTGKCRKWSAQDTPPEAPLSRWVWRGQRPTTKGSWQELIFWKTSHLVPYRYRAVLHFTISLFIYQEKLWQYGKNWVLKEHSSQSTPFYSQSNAKSIPVDHTGHYSKST